MRRDSPCAKTALVFAKFNPKFKQKNLKKYSTALHRITIKFRFKRCNEVLLVLSSSVPKNKIFKIKLHLFSSSPLEISVRIGTKTRSEWRLPAK